MSTLIRQELYKLVHRTGTWVGLGMLLGVQFFALILALRIDRGGTLDDMLMSDFFGVPVILLTMIALTATQFSAEFQYGTIRPLLYRRYYRRQIFISKVIVTLIYFLALRLVSLIVSFSFGAIFSGDRAVLFSSELLEEYFKTSGSDTLLMLFILSFVIMLSTFFKSNSLATTLGIVSYFVGIMMSDFAVALLYFMPWLKWTPAVFLYRSPGGIDQKLGSVLEMSPTVFILFSLAYTVLFTFLAFLSFRRRSV